VTFAYRASISATIIRRRLQPTFAILAAIAGEVPSVFTAKKWPISTQLGGLAPLP
jgi:hypothetical protein